VGPFPKKWSDLLQKSKYSTGSPLLRRYIFDFEKSKVKIKDAKVAKMPKWFFGRNSPANVFLSRDQNVQIPGPAVPRTAYFLILFYFVFLKFTIRHIKHFVCLKKEKGHNLRISQMRNFIHRKKVAG